MTTEGATSSSLSFSSTSSTTKTPTRSAKIQTVIDASELNTEQDVKELISGLLRDESLENNTDVREEFRYRTEAANQANTVKDAASLPSRPRVDVIHFKAASTIFHNWQDKDLTSLSRRTFGRGLDESNLRMNQWDRLFQRLVKYKNCYGNTLVPTKYSEDPQLGTWVRNQRLASKKGRMKEDRKRMLDIIGFVWIIQSRPRRENYSAVWKPSQHTLGT